VAAPASKQHEGTDMGGSFQGKGSCKQHGDEISADASGLTIS
jgi:hypothetical protein